MDGDLETLLCKEIFINTFLSDKKSPEFLSHKFDRIIHGQTEKKLIEILKSVPDDTCLCPGPAIDFPLELLLFKRIMEIKGSRVVLGPGIKSVNDLYNTFIVHSGPYSSNAASYSVQITKVLNNEFRPGKIPVYMSIFESALMKRILDGKPNPKY